MIGQRDTSELLYTKHPSKLIFSSLYSVMNVLLSVCGTVSIAFLVVIILHFNRYFYLLYPAMVLIGYIHTIQYKGCMSYSPVL